MKHMTCLFSANSQPVVLSIQYNSVQIWGNAHLNTAKMCNESNNMFQETQVWEKNHLKARTVCWWKKLAHVAWNSTRVIWTTDLDRWEGLSRPCLEDRARTASDCHQVLQTTEWIVHVYKTNKQSRVSRPILLLPPPIELSLDYQSTSVLKISPTSPVP